MTIAKDTLFFCLKILPSSLPPLSGKWLLFDIRVKHQSIHREMYVDKK